MQVYKLWPPSVPFFNSWLGKQGFDEVVKKEVIDFTLSDDPPYVLFIRKLGFIRDRLRGWRDETVRKEGEFVSAAKDELEAFESILETRDLSEEEEWIL